MLNINYKDLTRMGYGFCGSSFSCNIYNDLTTNKKYFIINSITNSCNLNTDYAVVITEKECQSLISVFFLEVNMNRER